MRNLFLLSLSLVSAAAYAEPVLDIGSAKITGAPNSQRSEWITRSVTAHHADYLKCYTTQLASEPTLGEQRMHVTLIVTVDGKVTGAAAVGDNAAIGACVQAYLKTLRFPNQPEKTQIDYTFAFAPRPLPAQQPAQGGAFASITGTGDISSGFDDANIYGGLLGNEAGEMQGGFGYGSAGFGPGGGGTGWGTIGTGRYGKIGHGSGTGSGYGVGGGRGGMRGKSGAVPTVSVGQPNAQGDLDKAIIRRYIKRNIQKIEYCYEKTLLAKPGLKGTITATFEISQEGSVTSSSASGVDPDVSTCVAAVIKTIEFPKPKGGGKVAVNYPFTFSPAETDTPAPTPAKPAAPKK